ncbi:transcription antitermination factor NusB [Acidobacteria bacterium AH-259-D05]|nr:transcription antitermination factor NusB [Acidobacteria bacterium AH-259-D05]
MSSRRKARELALQLLFQQDLNQFTPEEVLEVFWKVNRADPENRKFAEFLFRKAFENQAKIDELIRKNAQHWRLERMAAVDRNILRMAVSEFLYGETPQIVVIDEAIEIARRFSTAESTQFVNGVLDAIKEEIEERAVREG